jgi:hypothetical protein
MCALIQLVTHGLENMYAFEPPHPTQRRSFQSLEERVIYKVARDIFNKKKTLEELQYLPDEIRVKVCECVGELELEKERRRIRRQPIGRAIVHITRQGDLVHRGGFIETDLVPLIQDHQEEEKLEEFFRKNETRNEKNKNNTMIKSFYHNNHRGTKFNIKTNKKQHR